MNSRQKFCPRYEKYASHSCENERPISHDDQGIPWPSAADRTRRIGNDSSPYCGSYAWSDFDSILTRGGLSEIESKSEEFGLGCHLVGMLGFRSLPLRNGVVMRFIKPEETLRLE